MWLLVTSMRRGTKPETLDLTVELLAEHRTFLTSHPEFGTPLHRLWLLTPVTLTSNWIEVLHPLLPHSCSATLEIDISLGLTTHSRTRADNEFPVRTYWCTCFEGKPDILLRLTGID